MTEQPHTPTLHYLLPADVLCVIRAEPGQVVLVIEGPPPWSRAALPLALLVLCVGLAVGSLLAAWEISGGRHAREVLAAGAIAVIGALACAAWLARCCRRGPVPNTYRLTSRHLTPDPDPQTFFSDPPQIIRLDDVLPWSHGRRLVLRLVPRLAPFQDLAWSGSLDDLERLVAELRGALRLDAVR